MYSLLIPLLLALSCARPEPQANPPPVRTQYEPRAELTAPSAVKERRLVIASWNIEWLHEAPGQGPVKRQGRDFERLRSYARNLDADIVALQEVNGAAAARRVFDDGEYDFHFSSRANVQNTGFAYRRHLKVTPHPDLETLSLDGTLRHGVDLSVQLGEVTLRLLNVHLKSGCFSEPLTSPGRACSKLRSQLPLLEQWIDARAMEAQPFLVLGDFNRHLGTHDSFWKELDDGAPAGADLELPSNGLRSKCQGGKHPHLVDHIVLGRDALPYLAQGSFEQLVFDPEHQAREQLSDHCPIRVQLRIPSGAGTVEIRPGAQPSPPERLEQKSPLLLLKGNISSGQRKLYHRPDCPGYESTVIEPAAGERYFTTEAEAVAAGFALAGNCPR